MTPISPPSSNPLPSVAVRIFLRAAGVLLAVFCLIVAAGCGPSRGDSAGHSTARAAAYHCPMHPAYVSDKPGDCPICGMKLVPIAGDKPATASQNIAGRVSIVLSPEKRQLIGLATSPVERRRLSRLIRTAGTVSHDETKFSRIAPRFGGWISSLQANYVGQMVEKGDPLFTAYSPEVYTSENDYLLAARGSRSATNHFGSSPEGGRPLLDAARRRLELLQVDPEEIQTVETQGHPGNELTFRAPLSGHILAKNVVNGQAFNAGDTLYKIADLGHLWILASIFESELAEIKTGQSAQVTFPYLNNQTFETSIAFINPHIDPQTRRAEVRLELENPGHQLKPDMWADVAIEIKSDLVLAIPASAVIDSGTRYVAFVDAQGNLEPRDVTVGIKTDDYIEVVNGLKEGEKVVSRALFLIDSESQLKAAIAGMSNPEPKP